MVGDLPFELINNVRRLEGNPEFTLHLNKKENGQYQQVFIHEPKGSNLNDVYAFFGVLEQKLSQRRSWYSLERKLTQNQYTELFMQVLKSVKHFEETQELEITPTSKGLNGAKIISIPKETGGLKPVGIFKGISEDPLYKKMLGQASLLLESRDGLAKARAEIIAYYLAKHLGFEHTQESDKFGKLYVPEAIMLNLNGEPGVFVQFLSGYTDPDHSQELFAKAHENQDELRNFQMLVIYDFLIGNLDRHEDNLFVRKDSNNSFEILRFIDQGNTFPFKSPLQGSISGRNMYKWTNLPVAKLPFLPEIQEHIIQYLNPKYYSEAIKKIPVTLWNKFFPRQPCSGCKCY